LIHAYSTVVTRGDGSVTAQGGGCKEKENCHKENVTFIKQSACQLKYNVQLTETVFY